MGNAGAAMWASMPGCSPPYFVSEDDYVVASSRPGLLKAAFDLPVNKDYWRWIATVGYPLDNSSPYEGARCVLGGTALRTDSGSAAIVDYLLPSHGQIPRTAEEAAAAEEVVRTELLRRPGRPADTRTSSSG